MSEARTEPTFSEALVEYRRAAHISRAELARRAELSPRSIYYLESGEHQPYVDTIHRLAAALRLSDSDRTRLERLGRPTDRARRATVVAARPKGDSVQARPVPEPPRGHNLPAQATSFVGRERELADLHGLLETARLVTLTGPGGIGKTRLALEVAAGKVDAYADGAWLVELAGVSDPRLVPEVVGGVLVRHEQGRRAPLEWLADALRSRRLLLVLDNCEHLVDACAALADHLLRACPGVTILATSREGLGVVGEHTWRVPPLQVPTGEAGLTRLRQEPAVRLFVERARAASATFDLTDENAGAVAEICRRLDGLPLAIELAAGRTGLLMAEEIVTRLDDRFRLLTGGARTRPARHQTLRAVVDWSYDLIDEPCRVLFERLAPFAGGFTLDAAEAIVGDGSWVTGDGGAHGGPSSPRTQHPAPITHVDTLDLLGQLVNQSLVQAEEESNGTRYRLLETLRAYAAERLAARGEAEVVQRRHAEYYLALAEAADEGLRGPEQARWAARLAREYDNLQAALRWSVARGEAVLAHRLVGALWTYWYTRPRGVEGANWYERVLALNADGVPPVVRAWALAGATGQALLEGNLALAQQRSQASLTLFQQIGDGREHVQTLLMAGMVAASAGEPGVALAQFQAGLAMARRTGGTRGEGWTLGLLGQLATFAGDYARARELLETSGQLLRAVGDMFGLAGSLIRGGDVACAQGNLEEARAAYEESLTQFRAAGLPLAPPTLLHNLAYVLGAQGELARAATLFCDGLELYRDRGDLAGVARCLLSLAELALDAHEPHLAAHLLGAAEPLPRGRPLGLLGGWVWTSERRPYEQQVAATRDALGSGAFDAAFAEGRRLTPDQAAAEASSALAATTSLAHLRLV